MQILQYKSFNYIIFLILCAAVYYIYPAKLRWIALLAASVIFYAFAGLEKLPYILAGSVVIWFASKCIAKTYDKAEAEANEKKLSGKEKAAFMAQCKKKCRNCFLLPAMVVMIGFLCYCKFFDRAINGISGILSGGTITWEVIVPLGVSYYTFSSLGYLLDVYWKKTKYINNYFKFALCVFYFPHIVQGPIARYQKLLPQFTRENRFDYKRVCFGIQLMLYGYFKKMVIADRLAIFTGQVMGNIDAYEGLVLVITLIFSSFQVYADFSGCVDLVRGTSQIFGIELDNNFNHPFFSKSTAEFWRRWHITLGTWFKDYVYMPTATSAWLIKLISKAKEKFGKTTAKNLNTIIPLTVVWILTGVWHGTGWNYVAWGLYYGIIIICATLFAPKYKKLAEVFHIDMTSKGYSYFQMFRTFCVFTIGRLITVPGSLHATWQVIRQTFKSFNPWILWDGTLYQMGLNYKNICLAILSLLIVRKISILQEQGSVRERIANKNIVIRWAIYYGVIFAIIIFGIYGPGYNAGDFVYAQF